MLQKRASRRRRRRRSDVARGGDAARSPSAHTTRRKYLHTYTGTNPDRPQRDIYYVPLGSSITFSKSNEDFIYKIISFKIH